MNPEIDLSYQRMAFSGQQKIYQFPVSWNLPNRPKALTEDKTG